MSTNPNPGHVQVSSHGGQAEVTWEHPPLNIFTIDMLHQLTRALRTPEVQDSHIVVLRGLGKCWSAGFSIEEHLRPQVSPMLGAFHEALQTLWDLPSITLAQVHGSCLGGGLELLMACDLGIAGTGSVFGQPEIRLGVFAPFGAAFYAEMLGPKQAGELMFTGATFDATRAEALGLVGRVVPDSELAAAVALTAATVGSYRKEALRLLKQTLRRTSANPWPRLADAERTYLEELMVTPDAEEGLQAFLQKRTPVWREA